MRRAIASALGQSMEDLEVIVVVDGPDPETEQVCRDVDDPRLQWVVNGESLGGGGARNAGVNASRGRWIAFLDDDDEWLPEKLERQLELAARVDGQFPVVVCRLVSRTPTHDEVWPRRPPRSGEPVSDYLFFRTGPFAGEGGIQTSTIMAPRELLAAVPFDETLIRHQDWDWILRAATVEGTTLAMVPAPLVVWHRDIGRPRIADLRSWRYTSEWGRARRELMTPRAYAAFHLIFVGDLVLGPLHAPAIAAVVGQAFRHGRPMGWLIFLGKILLPRRVRARAGAAVAGIRRLRQGPS